VAGKADVQTHLNERRSTLGSLFADWANAESSADGRIDVLESYLKECDFGEVQRVGSGRSVHTGPVGHDPKRPSVLVVGRHDIDDLGPPTDRASDAALVGPGIAGRLGPTVAFAEGALAARSLVGDGPVNLEFLSLGEGDTYNDVASIVSPDAQDRAEHDTPIRPTQQFDAVYLTNAVSWSPHHPTLTVGSRGSVVVELALDAGHPIDDFATSGAFRNPLTKMTQLLGSLRGADGRIVLPDFYERAHPPDTRLRAAMYDNGHDPDEWASHLMVARPEGGLSALERASMWPGVSVLSVAHDSAGRRSAPSRVVATIACYLVPDQRPVEIERSIRDWFQAVCPDELRPTVTVVDAHRPWRCDLESRPAIAQRLAALRLFGHEPIAVPAGGGPGAGEIAFALDAPVSFAGISPPTRSLGTRRESLSWTHLEAGAELAAETCLQLRRT